MKSNSLFVLCAFGAVVWAASPALGGSGACCGHVDVFEPPPRAVGYCVVIESSDCPFPLDYAGDGTSCRTATCIYLGSPRGACCNSSNGSCHVVDGGQAACDDSFGGSYLGDGTSCNEDPSSNADRCPTGATVPTLSVWSLGGLALLLLSGVALKFGRRRARD